MTEYSRKVTYIYECCQYEPVKQCGYIKTVIKEDAGLCEIFFDSEQPLTGGVRAGYYKCSDAGINICISEKKTKGTTPDFTMQFNAADVEGLPADEIDGIVIVSGDIFYFSPWSDEPFDRETVSETESFKKLLVPEPKEDISIQEIPDFLKVKKKESTGKVKYDKSYYRKINDWKDLFGKYDVEELFDDDLIYNCVKIGYDDLKYLPGTCKRLINNSFLLHGIYLYGHVLIGKYKCKKNRKVYILAVPGNYDKSECVIAAMFGFENFKRIQVRGKIVGDSGYWYTIFKDDE